MVSSLRLFYFGTLIYCLLFFISWTVQIVRRRRPDRSVPRRNPSRGVVSAFTRGMLPWRKESARNNLPDYAAGILYHLGTFSCLTILAFPVLLFGRSPGLLSMLSAGLACGVYLLLKRVFKRQLRCMSSPGDYIANAAVDLMQLSVIFVMLGIAGPLACYVAGCGVLLYLPFGKLKHSYYFFPSRLLLGRSYGRRGVMI